MICNSCGYENPPGTRFCLNRDCQAYLDWDGSQGDGAVQPATNGPGPRPPAAGPPRPPGPATAGGPAPAGPAADRSPAGRTNHAAAPRAVQPVKPKPAVAATPTAARAPLRYEFKRERPTPVSVTPMEEIASAAPAGQSSTHGRQSLWFGVDHREMSVDPGGEAVVTAQVLNKGTVVEGVDVRVLGVPQDWVKVEPAKVNLDVGGQATMRIRLAPPKEVTTPPGRADVEVCIWSQSNPQVRCADRLKLEVGAFHELEAEAVTKEVVSRRDGEMTITLKNNGNQPLGAGAQPNARAAAEGKVLLRFEPKSVALKPGESATMRVGLRATKRLVTGPPVTHPIEVHVLGGGAARTLSTNFVQRPVFPAWVPRVAGIVVPLMIALLGYLAVNLYQNRPQVVPDVVGQPVDLAQANLGKAGFKGVPSAKPSSDPAGTVLSEDPKGGTHHKKGEIVQIGVSQGPPQVQLGDLTGMPEDQAVTTLKNQGLKVNIVKKANDNVPVGQVAEQVPGVGTSVNAGSAVTLTISSGPHPETVPKIVGLSEGDAIALLGQSGLRYVPGGSVPNSAPAGQVISQDPPAGQQIPSGSGVTGVIAAPLPVPTTTPPPPTTAGH